MQDAQRVEVADLAGHRGDRDRVGQVAAGRGLRQQQMQPDHLLHNGHIARRQPDAPGQLRRDRGAHDAVVAVEALADVVQQRAQHEQVRPGHVAGVPRGRYLAHYSTVTEPAGDKDTVHTCQQLVGTLMLKLLGIHPAHFHPHVVRLHWLEGW